MDRRRSGLAWLRRVRALARRGGLDPGPSNPGQPEGAQVRRQSGAAAEPLSVFSGRPQAEGLMSDNRVEIDRLRREIRTTALRQAALVADEMAADLQESIDNGTETGPFTYRQVINGYKMIARLIRQLDEE